MEKEKKFIKPSADIIELIGDLDTIGASDPYDDNDDVGEFTPGMIH